MKTINIKEAITNDTVDKLVSFFNEHEKQNITILLNSAGGEVPAMDALLSLINKRANSITLLAYGEVSSAAFFLFFNAKCKKDIIGDCLGMFHLSYGSYDIDSRGRPVFKPDKASMLRSKNFTHNRTIELCKSLSMTRSQISKIEKGDDVWFQPDRLKQFLTKSI
jgi:hypothetical protein